MFKKLESMFDGSRDSKGFYIVLCLCAAVVGTSSWLLLSGTGTDVEDSAGEQAAVYVAEADPDGGETAAVMAQSTPEPTEQPQEAAEDAGYIWPVSGAVERPYAMQTLLYDVTMCDWRCHEGVDIACANGTEVCAAADGTVVRVWEDGLLGVCLEIQHDDGVNSVYANLAAEPAVTAGQRVQQGQVLALVGGSALGEAAQSGHLHFAMSRNGLSADPLDYLTPAE